MQKLGQREVEPPEKVSTSKQKKREFEVENWYAADKGGPEGRRSQK